MGKPTTLIISAKCSDSFYAELHDEDGVILNDYDGYVPKFMPGEHFGDYVQLTIDLATGTILNWKTPTKKQLKEVFPEAEEK